MADCAHADPLDPKRTRQKNASIRPKHTLNQKRVPDGPFAGHDIPYRLPGSGWQLVGLWQKNHTKMNSRDGHGFGRDQAMVGLSLPDQVSVGAREYVFHQV